MKPVSENKKQKEKTRGIKRKRSTQIRSKKIRSTTSSVETNFGINEKSIGRRIKLRKRMQYQNQGESSSLELVCTPPQEETEVKNNGDKESNEINKDLVPKSEINLKEECKIPLDDIKLEVNCTTEEPAKSQIDFSQFVKEKKYSDFNQQIKSQIPTTIHEDEINTNRFQNDEDEYTTRICLYFTTATITSKMQIAYSGTDHLNPNTITTPICTSSGSIDQRNFLNLTPNINENSPIFDFENHYLTDPFYTYNISNLSSPLANIFKIMEPSPQLSNTSQVTSNEENDYQITISNVCSISEAEFSEMNSDKDNILTILNELRKSEDGNNNDMEDSENFDPPDMEQCDLCPCENFNDLIEYANLNLDAIVEQNIEL